MKVTTTIFAHGDAIETCKRHLPIWQAHSDQIVFVSPVDNPLVINDFSCVTYQRREHRGKNSIERLLFAFKAALLFEADYYVFLEYDALLLRRPIPREHIQGNLFNEQVLINKQLDHQKSCFIHFPWIFPADKLKDFLNRVEIKETDIFIQDIWLAQKFCELDISVFNLLAVPSKTSNDVLEGCSTNTFGHHQNILDRALEMTRKHGAYAFHGIKTEEILNQFLEAANQKYNT